MELDLPTLSKKIKIKYVFELRMIDKMEKTHIFPKFSNGNTPLSGNFFGVTESCHLMTMSCTWKLKKKKALGGARTRLCRVRALSSTNLLSIQFHAGLEKLYKFITLSLCATCCCLYYPVFYSCISTLVFTIATLLQY